MQAPSRQPGSAGGGEIVWSPPPDAWESSRVGRFARWVEQHGGPVLDDHQAMLSWSLEMPTEFWGAVAEHSVIWRQAPDSVLERVGPMPDVTWFPGARLNYAEHLVAHAATTPDAIALTALSDTRERIELTWRQLVDAVGRCRSALVRCGVGPGDRVVAYAPNVPETLIAFAAAASLGAVWSSCPPEFGSRAALDRWSQIDPILMFAVDGYRYGSRAVDRRDEVAAIRAGLPSLQHVVRIPYLDTPESLAGLDDEWEPWLGDGADLSFEPVPFDHPLYVLFSSGTTGRPKAIVHGHGGITLEHMKVLAFHHDLGPGDRFSWFTTTGWMMWNYLVSGLAVGAGLVLFDGDPTSPDLSRLWTMAADERLDVLGVSAPFVVACERAGLRPGDQVDLMALRQVGVTGAPLPASGFHWIVDAVGQGVQPCSISGGTDVCTAFVGGAPTVPVRAGELSTRLLGCDVRAFDEYGSEFADGVTGELVVVAPMPSMPVGFWGDDDGSRLRSAYFERFDGVWCHGDWVTFGSDGGCVISGRSDATLNRGGVRLGTGEFYEIVEAIDEIGESLVVHLEDPEGGAGLLVLLVSCVPGVTLDDELRTRLRDELRRSLSPRHAPDEIHEVGPLPHTSSGKRLEVPIKRLLLGQDPTMVTSRDALDVPDRFDEIARWAARWRSARDGSD